MKYHQVNKPPSSTPGSRQEHSLQWSFLLDFSLFVFLAGQGGEDNSSNWVFPGGSGPMQKTQVQSLGQEDPLEKEMATCAHCSCPRNPMDKGACKSMDCKSMGSQRVE